MPGTVEVPSLEELDVQEVREGLGSARPRRAPLGRSLLLPLCPAAGDGQLGRAEGRGPPLRLAVRPAQQGVHAVPLGGEGPAEMPEGGPAGQPVRARLLQVSAGAQSC